MFDAYTARKAAPRILVAVIGINLSIYFCIAAVDIANVVGRGVAGLLTSPFVNAGQYDVGVQGFTTNVVGIAGGAGIFFGAGALGALVGGVVTVSSAPLAILGMLIILLIPIALVALAIMVTIIIRQALLIFLIIVSPVAIACSVLPGTDKYFKQWLDIFTKTLLVYPIICTIFAMSDVFASIIFRTAGNSIDAPIKIVTGIIVIYAPLFLIPFAFRLAGGVMGRLASVATSGAGKLADMGPIKGRREAAKRDFSNRMIQNRADMAGRLKERGSRARPGFGGATRNRVLKGLAGGVGGYNIEEQASAARAQMGKVLNDQIATGRDEEIRGLTVNKAAADAAFAAGDTSLRQVSADGKVQYKSLAGKWVDEADVDAGHSRWGKDSFAQQAALSYEMRKAANDEQVQDVSKRYSTLATGNGGWGMSDGMATGAFVGAGFENQGTHLEFKHTSFDHGAARAGAADGGASLNYAAFAEEAYEKKGTYALSQMSGHTIEQLREAHSWAVTNGDTATQRRVEQVAESFMTRYGGGAGVAAMEGDVPVAAAGAPVGAAGAGGAAPAGAAGGVYQTNAPGAAHVAEAVRKLAVDVGVYRPLDPSTDTHSATGPTTNDRLN